MHYKTDDKIPQGIRYLTKSFLLCATFSFFRPTQAQAPCGCNQNYYDQVKSCMSCQSSSSAHYSVKAQPDYELVCTSYNQPWKQINIPGQTATTASTTTTTSAAAGQSPAKSSDIPSPGGTTGEKSSQSSNLSSGALAGM